MKIYQDSILQRGRGGKASTHALQTGSKLGVLLLDLQLRAGGLSIGDGIDNLRLGTSKLSGTLKVLEGLRDLALLQQKLRHRSYGDIAFRINCKPVSVPSSHHFIAKDRKTY